MRRHVYAFVSVFCFAVPFFAADVTIQIDAASPIRTIPLYGGNFIAWDGAQNDSNATFNNLLKASGRKYMRRRKLPQFVQMWLSAECAEMGFDNSHLKRMRQKNLIRTKYLQDVHCSSRKTEAICPNS